MKSIYEYPPPILQQMHRKETTNSGVSKVNAMKRDDCLVASDLNNAFGVVSEWVWVFVSNIEFK